jgi:hypothetical protein
MDDQSANKDIKPEKEETYITWNSPSRLFKKRDKEYFTNVGAIVFLLIVILVFAREYLFILAVLSIVFFIYVTSTVPPEDVNHKITNLGLESAGHFYRWETLVEFWFEEQWGQTIITVRPVFGTRIIVLLGSENKDKVQELISQHIPYRDKPQKSWVDNAATWLTKKVPLEKPS